jgi:hypothetical protein
MPINIIDSEILSKEESRNAPFIEVCFVTLATLPSTTSKNPDIKRRMLPITEAYSQENTIDGNTVVDDDDDDDDDAIAYTTPAAMEVAKLSVVQKFADSPKEAKVIPSFVSIGCNESLNLLSNDPHLSYLLIKIRL